MDDLLRDFVTETVEHLDTVDSELVRFERNPADIAILRNVFRLVHTIKGTCGFIGLPRLEALAHAAEGLMGRLREGAPVTSDAVTLILATVDRIKLILAGIEAAAAEPEGSDSDIIGPLERATELAAQPAASPAMAVPPPAAPATPAPAAPVPEPPAARAPAPSGPRSGASRRQAQSQTIRVAVDTLEHLMTMVSELVLTRNQLLDLARRDGRDGEDGFKIPLQRLSHVTGELQDGIMKTRMQPIGSAWAKLPRVVRDLSKELGKRFELVMTGADTELDRQVLDMIRDSLTHLVRNSADHGLENPEDRVRAGKSALGTIRLDAKHEGGTITIDISDDGRGLDYGAIRRKALAVGIASEADLARMSEQQLGSLIFYPGFSTAAVVSHVSGRGVGLDVVKSNIDAIGGTVEIESTAGRGATFTIKIPLTLAIIAALIIEVGGQRFALPQIAVVELVRVRPGSDHALERINGSAVVRLRDDLLPVVDLAGVLRMPRRLAADEGFVIVAQVGRQRFGLLVDAVLETEEIVVKPMCARLKAIPIFSGTTIMGDGSVVLILDANGIGRTVGYNTLRSATDLLHPQPAVDEDDEPITLLLFRGSGATVKAVPLSLVTRLEEIDASGVEEVGGTACVQYRGRLMPLLPIAGELRREGLQPVIVVTQAGQPIGLAVHEIVDIVDVVLDIAPVAGRPDLIGSAIVRGRATEIVELAGYLPRPEQAGFGAASAQESETVLLVDDDPFFRGMLTPVLKAAGYRVRTAADAGEALGIMASHRIGIVVADVELPGRSGLDLAADLRREAAFRDTTIVILASSPEPGVLDRARALDVFDVVARFDRSGLMATLADASGAMELAA